MNLHWRDNGYICSLCTAAEKQDQTVHYKRLTQRPRAGMYTAEAQLSNFVNQIKAQDKYSLKNIYLN